MEECGGTLPLRYAESNLGQPVMDLAGARFITPGHISRPITYSLRINLEFCEDMKFWLGLELLNPSPLSKFLVGTVAQHSLGTVLAAAKIYGFRFGCLVFDRGKFAALVAAIAERLGGTFAAGTPPVAFAGFHLNGKRGFLGDNGLLV